MNWRLTLALLVFGPVLTAGRAQQVPEAGLAILDVPDAGHSYVSGPVTAFCRGADGLLFVGSTVLAAFDGTAWRRFEIPGASRILGLAADKGGRRIWIAANGAIGYLQKESGGEWTFISLSNRIHTEELDEIRYVLPMNDGAIFVSRANVIRWDGHEVSDWSLPSSVRLYPFNFGDQLLIYRKGTGLLRMSPTGPSLWMRQDSLPSKDPLVALLQVPGGGFFAVFSDGVFLYRDGTWRELGAASRAVRGKQAMCALRLDDDTIAIGTFFGGAMLVKPDGSVISLVNSQSGLADDNVNSLWAENGQLWIGMATSLARLPSARSASLYNQRIGLGSGAVRRVLIQAGRPAIIGTHRVYRRGLPGATAGFLPAGLVRLDPYWLLLRDGLILDDELWMCGSEGIWRVTGERSVLLPGANDIYCMIAPRGLDHALLAFGASASWQCSQMAGTWTVSPAGAHYAGVPTSVAGDAAGKIWLATDTGWVYAYEWSQARGQLIDGARFRVGTGPLLVTSVAGRVFAFSGGDILAFDPAKGQFDNAPEFSDFTGLAAAQGGGSTHAYWLVQSKLMGKTAPIALVRIDATDAPHWTGLIAPGLEQAAEPFTLSVTQQGSDETVWIGGMNTLLRLEASGLAAAKPVAGLTPEPGVRDESGQMLFAFGPMATADADAGVVYQTKLEPVERNWLPPEASASRRFSGLAAGRYRLRARAIDRFGQSGSVAVSEFEIPEPWYATAPALALWIGTGAFLVMAGYRWRLRRLEAQADRLNQLVNERTRELSLSNTAKSEFLENISHEIRNPLNGIVGLVNLLDVSELSTRQREQARGLRYCCQTLSRAIDDILDYSKLEYGTIPLNEREFSLPVLLESVRMHLVAAAAQNQNAISIRCPSSLTLFFGDDEKIKTVLCNFVGNALKYAAGTRVDLCVSEVGEEILFEVTDEGPGIPPEEQELIFKKFVRGSRAKASSIQGSGIGLATSRLTAKLLSGSVGVESPPAGRPHGATFFLKLPLRRSPRPATIKEPGAEGAAALIVEDQDYNRMVIMGILDRLGIRSVSAQTGEEALALAAGAPELWLIFSDLELPGIKGPEMARRLRALPGGDGLVLIGTSAYDSPETPLRCREAGMNDFLLKPLRLEAVQEAIERALRSPLPRPALDRSALELYAHHVAGGLDQASARYGSELAAELEGLARSIQGGLVTDIAAAAHRVRSHASLVGATALSEAAAGLEREARNGAVSIPWRHFYVVRAEASAVQAELMSTAPTEGKEAGLDL